MKKITLGFLLAAAAMPAISDSNFSAEILLGLADQESDIGGFRTPSGDDSSVGIRAAFNLNDYISFELAHFNYGDAEKSYVDSFGDDIKETISSEANNIGVKASVPVGGSFSINGRLGLSAWDYEYSYSDSFFGGEVFSEDDSGTDPYYGVGVQWEINEHLLLGAEYNITSMSITIDNVDIDNEVRNLALSIGYIF